MLYEKGDDQMEQELSREVWQKVIEWLDSTKEFVIDQAPVLIQETLRYYHLSIIFGIVILSIIFLSSLAFFLYHFFHPIYEEYNFMSGKTIVSLLFGGLISLISFVILFCIIDDAIKIHVAPKYFLIQKFTKIIKGNDK